MSTMPRPIAISDQQLSAIMRAAEPLSPADRGQFLSALADALRDEDELGDGVLGRTIRRVIRPFFKPPTLTPRPTICGAMSGRRSSDGPGSSNLKTFQIWTCPSQQRPQI
jgi:hypothetical protein